MTSSNASGSPSTIIVIGAGPAGLSASAELVSNGIRIILIEQRQILGGRASAYQHRESDEILDLGPHTVIEANRNFLDHLSKVGTRDRIVFPPSLSIRFLHPTRGAAEFHCPSLPAPWGFLWGVMTYRFLPVAERLKAVSLGRFLASTSSDQLPDISVDQWLQNTKVSPSARQLFWEPLILAVLNNHPQRLGLRSLGAIFRAGFLAPGQRTGLGFPLVDWGSLVTGNIRQQIVSIGGEVIIGQRVERIWMKYGRAVGVTLGGDHTIQGDAVIAAVPPKRLASLLPEVPAWLTPALRFEWSPIVSLHWMVSNPLPIETPLAILNGPVNWIFSKSVPDSNSKFILSTITGGDPVLVSENRSAAVDKIASSIRQLFPGWDPGINDQIVLHRIPKATISIAPGQDRLRPGPGTDIPGLWIAGDWTNTSLPPTLESASLSGIRSAQTSINNLKLHC